MSDETHLPPDLTLAVQGKVWREAVVVQRDRLMVVVGRRHWTSSESTLFLYESLFYVTALLNLRRTVGLLHARLRSATVGEALTAFRKVVTDADLRTARAALHYSDKFTVGNAKEQRRNPDDDHSVSWEEAWEDERKVNFTIRVGPRVAIPVQEATEAAVFLANAAFGAATARTPE